LFFLLGTLLQVSWLRGSDLQVLSSAWTKFTGDDRIRIIPADQTHSWTLAINNVSIKDTGPYLCQVNTEPKLTLYNYLTVEGTVRTFLPECQGLVFTRELVELQGLTFYLVDVLVQVLVVRIDVSQIIRLFSEFNPT
jgi:hypothetical protein